MSKIEPAFLAVNNYLKNLCEQHKQIKTVATGGILEIMKATREDEFPMCFIETPQPTVQPTDYGNTTYKYTVGLIVCQRLSALDDNGAELGQRDKDEVFAFCEEVLMDILARLTEAQDADGFTIELKALEPLERRTTGLELGFRTDVTMVISGGFCVDQGKWKDL